MQCRPDARDRVRSFARAVACDERVVDADTLDPDTGPEPMWSATLILEPRAGGAPPALQREAQARDLTLRTQPQGPYWEVVALP